MELTEHQQPRGGVPVMTMAESAVLSNNPREMLRVGIDILARAMMRCQGAWYWANEVRDVRWYGAGEWACRHQHDALCEEYYGRAA